MRIAYCATGDAFAFLLHEGGTWSASLTLKGLPAQCLAVDPRRPEVVYCGTFGEGLWRSEDAGQTWLRCGATTIPSEVTAAAVVPGTDTVWAGTEPSAIFRSDDGGGSWRECAGLRDLPSAPTWSFPPRPWTSHVRWIAPDPVQARRLFVGIELGGIMRSDDGGETWHDRVPGSQYDAHTIRTHPLAAGRLYEAAGGGYAESLDAGHSWRHVDTGLTRRYVWGLAVDPGDPEVMLVSASPGPREAHNPATAEAAMYRRAGTDSWQEITAGLPEPSGTRAYLLSANEAEPGVFYAMTREADLYRSDDAGVTWERQEIAWPAGYRAPDVRGLAVVGEG